MLKPGQPGSRAIMRTDVCDLQRAAWEAAAAKGPGGVRRRLNGERNGLLAGTGCCSECVSEPAIVPVGETPPSNGSVRGRTLLLEQNGNNEGPSIVRADHGGHLLKLSGHHDHFMQDLESLVIFS